MRNAHVKYMCYPSVVCVGKETEVYIQPRDVSLIFRDEWEYELAVVGLMEDQLDYHSHIPLDHEFEIKNGCLVFRHFFDKEQKYSIRFCKKGQKEIKIELYAVEEDLYSLRPLKGDLHTHTYYSDGSDGISMTPADYREEGFDFFSLTDHNRMYTSRLAKELYDGVDLGMHIMAGEEIHTPGSLVHIVHVGGSESVCDKYIKDIEKYKAEVEEIAKTLTDIPEQYRDRVAMAKWTSDNIHNAGGLAIFAHPYWTPNKVNVSPELIDLLYTPELFDAFELVGGVRHEYLIRQLALWQEKALEGKYLPPVGSSDSHNHDFEVGGFGRNFTIVFAKENTTESILEAIKNGYTLAAELPKDGNNEVSFYGKLRLVTFANFLYNNYFNETWRLCVGEGILMRRYAEGEDVSDVLSALAPTVENFYKKFYGITKPVGIPSKASDFVDKTREIQLTQGPKTKGSSLFIYGGNECRQ